MGTVVVPNNHHIFWNARVLDDPAYKLRDCLRVSRVREAVLEPIAFGRNRSQHCDRVASLFCEYMRNGIVSVHPCTDPPVPNADACLVNIDNLTFVHEVVDQLDDPFASFRVALFVSRRSVPSKGCKHFANATPLVESAECILGENDSESLLDFL